MPKSSSEKRRLCSKLSVHKARVVHGPEGTGCWEGEPCHKRHTYYRPRELTSQRKLSLQQSPSPEAPVPREHSPRGTPPRPAPCTATENWLSTMLATQLELKLWEDLEVAATTPETADLIYLWQELESAIGSLPHEQRLPMAGKAIEQIAAVFALRSDSLLSAWEKAHNDEGPAVEEDVIAGLVRQTMNLELSELMEEPVVAHRQRQSRASATHSVAGPVDKATLLEAFDSEIEAVESEAQRQSGALSAAHEEDISGWAGAITKCLELRQSSQPVSLMQLQQE